VQILIEMIVQWEILVIVQNALSSSANGSIFVLGSLCYDEIVLFTRE